MRPKTGTGKLRKNVKVTYLKGKMIMTFKTNVPDRWIENPEQLPYKAFAEMENKDTNVTLHQRGMSLTTGGELASDLKQSVAKVSKHCQSASLGHHSNFHANSKTRENFRSFGSKDDIISSNKSHHLS